MRTEVEKSSLPNSGFAAFSRRDSGRPARPRARRAVAAGFLLLGLAATAGWAASEAPGKAGESIYLHGVLGSGAWLEGSREAGGLRTKGADAACVNCHQRSGLGSAEGRNIIPPVAGLYLFHERVKGGDDPDLPYVEGMRANRCPYTDATLPRALPHAVHPDAH